MRNLIGGGLMGLGYVSGGIFGLWAFVLDLGVLTTLGGFWLALVGLLLFPVAMALAPFYAGFAWGDWHPLGVTVAGTLMMWVFMGIGGAVLGSGKP